MKQVGGYCCHFIYKYPPPPFPLPSSQAANRTQLLRFTLTPLACARPVLSLGQRLILMLAISMYSAHTNSRVDSLVGRREIVSQLMGEFGKIRNVQTWRVCVCAAVYFHPSFARLSSHRQRRRSNIGGSGPGSSQAK